MCEGTVELNFLTLGHLLGATVGQFAGNCADYSSFWTPLGALLCASMIAPEAATVEICNKACEGWQGKLYVRRPNKSKVLCPCAALGYSENSENSENSCC